MFKFFKNSNFFDITLWSLLLTAILIVIVIVSMYPKTKPAGEKAVAIKSTTLSYEDNEIEKINKGDTVVILGQTRSNYSIKFWVQTKSGQRGFVQQDAIDDKAIVFKEKKVDGLSVKNGEIVNLIGLSKKEGSCTLYDIKSDDGKIGTVRADAIITEKGYELAKYTLNDRRSCYMSKQKFERLYLGKTFDETENIYSKALVVLNKNGQKKALYELRVFDKKNGIFYKPTIVFENDIVKSYSMEEAANYKKSWFLNNRLFLKYLPFSDKILDVGFFATLIKGNTFETPALADYTNSNFNKAISIAWAVFVGIGGLLWIFVTNLLIPLLLFGLLKLRYPLIFVSNKFFPILFLVTAIITTYIWLVLGLSYMFLWWFFIPILIHVLFFANGRVQDFFSYNPPQRCANCKRLYSINHQKKELIGDKKEWRKEEKRGKLLNSATKKWQTADEVTTYDVYSDGSKRNYRKKLENVQNHSETTRTYQYDMYDVLYRVLDYKHTHVCSCCGEIYFTYSQQLIELDRKYKDSYAHSSTHTNY